NTPAAEHTDAVAHAPGYRCPSRRDSRAVRAARRISATNAKCSARRSVRFELVDADEPIAGAVSIRLSAGAAATDGRRPRFVAGAGGAGPRPGGAIHRR